MYVCSDSSFPRPYRDCIITHIHMDYISGKDTITLPFVVYHKFFLGHMECEGLNLEIVQTVHSKLAKVYPLFIFN